ncbi:MAG: spondin domain-containing protein [Pacificimonas sp.]
MRRSKKLILAGMVSAAGFAAAGADARPVDLTVTIENLSPTDSISFAPLRFGFGNGSFDAFDIGTEANAAITSIAEGGTGTDWLPAFAAADPDAIIASSSGPLLPGAAQEVGTFRVDTEENRFFTFANMVIPSNDLFLGNDNPMAFNLFDVNGNLQIFDITQTASQIWNNGSEVADPANAAFVQGGNNAARTLENGLIEFAFDELLAFNGVTTAAGYVFQTQIGSSDEIFRISFKAVDVPEPAALAPFATGLALLGIGAFARRLRRAKRAA